MIQDRDRPDIGSRPVPDPTLLTTQQLVREIAALKELLETRLDAMDIATELNKQATDKIPCMISDAVKALEKLQNEKFASIGKQFDERDTRSNKIEELGQKAIDAALKSAKEAVTEQNTSNSAAIGKMEANFTKLLDALGDRVTDLKERLDRGEGAVMNRKETEVTSHQQQSWIIPLVVVGLLTLISIGVSVASIVIHIPK